MKKLLLWICVACFVAGCSSSPPALNSDQEKQSSQLDEIAKKSGGDWNKLSDADKKTMIDIGGSEQGAKMMLLGKSGKVGHHGGGEPGAPAPGAKPGG